LLSLLPVISDRSPPVFLTPTFAAAVSGSSGEFSHVIDCEFAEAEQNYKPQPPEIGDQGEDHQCVTVRATQISENFK
jgi:hypothetical protein